VVELDDLIAKDLEDTRARILTLRVQVLVSDDRNLLLDDV